MRSASPCTRAAALWIALALAATAGAASAQTVDVRDVFAGQKIVPMPTAEQVLERALDNLFGFDASISIVAKRRESSGRIGTSEFLVQRKRTQGAQRLLVVSVRPANVRGTRVLQVNYDDGREETFAYVPSANAASDEPMRARYRLSEPFLGTWYEIGQQDETPTELLALSEYEVVGFEPGELENEPIYKVTLRPLAGRGYDWSEFLIARKDYVILEHRHYFARGQGPALVAAVPRSAMVSFEDRLVPQRMRYRDLLENAEIEVTLRHTALQEGSDALFFPRTFHRFPLGVLEATGASD
jgi:hypothetical protein